MFRKFTIIAFALSLVGFGVLGYLELSARLSQKQMRSVWRDVERDSERRSGRDPERGKTRTKRERKGSGRDAFKPLPVERRGPGKNQLGVLTIPKIGVEQVVLYDSTPENLRQGPSLMKETEYPGRRGNAVIAGHRTSYGFPFRKLDQLKKGDRIIFKNSSGRVVYKVRRKFRVLPKDTSVLKQNRKVQMTLISCDPPFSATYRLIVTADAS